MGPGSLVCFLSSAHGPQDKRVFQKEARALQEAGLSVTHLCPARDGEVARDETVQGIRIRRYRRGRGIRGRVLGLPRLVREAFREEADVYHCNEVDSWLAGLVAARLRGSKVVFDVHEHYPSIFATRHVPLPLRSLASRFIRFLFKVLSPATDGLVFAKLTVADDFPRDHPVTTIVRNVPPLRLLEVLPERRGEADQRVVAVHTGVIRRARGWPQMIDALALTTPRLSLHVVGEFTDGTGSAFDERVGELGLADRVLVEPWLPFHEAFARLLGADIGLILFQPNIQNHVFASPHKLFDYMLAGLPVIAPAFAIEVADILTRYECGILVDSADPSDIAAALDRLARSSELRREMGLRGRRAVLEELNWEQESAKLLELYRRIGVRFDAADASSSREVG